MSAAVIYECARVARDGGLAALASVVRRRGSLPMSATAKMLITAGGARTGTIGGGCLEAEITERAQDVLEKREPIVSRHTLNAELAGDYGLTCGGTATVLIEPVYGDPILREVYGGGAEVLARGDYGVIVTATTWGDEPTKALVTSGSLFGRAPQEMVDTARALPPETEAPRFLHHFVLDPVNPNPPLVIFGGGHVGAALARAASFAGWRVTVVDDRADFADQSRHPAAERAVCCDFHDISSALSLTPRTYAVVATRGHQHDALIVDQLARRDLRYIGMLGSRRKVALTWKLLESWGIPGERLARIHAPVGLAIGADTPEEIAVSVVAEMVAVRRRGSRRRGGQAALSSTLTPAGVNA
jgi:xanthine dehydrogenase accessory factor